MMKKIILFAFGFVLINFAFGQPKNKLVGKWQAESAKVTSMYYDSYQFLGDGKFIFKPNEYDGLNRIISISGHYKIHGGTLYFRPEFTKEVIGGFPIRSESTTLSDTWEIIHGKVKVFPCKKTNQSAILKVDSDYKFIAIDDRKFFKIRE